MNKTTARAGAVSSRHAARSRLRSLAAGENMAGWLFVSPMLIGVFLLVLLPILATIVLSFADWNFVQGWSGIDWVGLGIVNPPMWIADPNFALVSIMMIVIWTSIGFNLTSTSRACNRFRRICTKPRLSTGPAAGRDSAGSRSRSCRRRRASCS